ncbi:hypothetical protein TRFO_35716 [Tritrichomonas foetus]|uniref:Uncharacterized protein n=1 Tax=Tritrichomonas foetus TaxID=1144522 RepID=A0A1J4JFF8_9EUKA|nr:hypothetical protein TRFO_35716 [Tritrichomonas foetus]|eukprot:OHS97950.1 hypothetical protein TRFO_35716 [Tritrichomonas foetus]
MIKADNCAHQINDNFLNRCCIVPQAVIIREVVQDIFKLIYPATLILLLMLLLLILPFIFSRTSRSSALKSQQLYNSIRFTLLSLFHRIAYSYSIIPLLSYFIHQPAPCSCVGVSTPEIYNSPYVYSFSSAMAGISLIDFASFSPKILYPLGIIVTIVPSICYILCGWASIGQSLFSISLAFLLFLYSSNTSNVVMLIESIILIIANFVVLMIEICSKTSKDIDSDIRISPSLIRGLLALFYELFLVLRFVQKNNWTFWQVEKGKKLIIDDQSTIRSSLLSGDQTASFFGNVSSDEIDGIVGMIFAIFMGCIMHVVKGI